VNHASAHRDCVLQHFVSQTELLERVNPASGKRKIDRSSANEIAFTWIGAPFVKLDFVSAPPQVGSEQSASQTTSDQNKLRHP
jgi:hypothetical protein